jgi:hypothetical protein
MAKMLGVWMHINNPNRSPDEDLNLTVGGVITLAPADLPGGLWNVRIRVRDEDFLSDNDVHTASFQRGVHDLEPTPFFTGVIVPSEAEKLRAR